MKKLFVFGIMALFVFAVVLNGCKTGEASDPGAIKPALINAHACSADDTCEINNARVEGNIYTSTLRTPILEVKEIRDYEGYPHFNTNVFFDGNINFGEAQGSELDATDIIASNLDVTNIVANHIRFQEQWENGTRYACIRENGEIFASLTPCR